MIGKSYQRLFHTNRNKIRRMKPNNKQNSHASHTVYSRIILSDYERGLFVHEATISGFIDFFM